jgi:PAS domain S-box-containing protein
LIELLGYSKSQFIEKEIWEIGFFKDIVANYDKFLELQQKEYIRYDDLPLETADGRKINVEFVSNVYPVNHHNIIQCNIRDITKRKKAEDAFRVSEEKYRHIFENVQDVFYQTDLAGIIREVSPSIKLFSEFSRDEIIGTTVSNLYYDPKDREILLDALMKNGELRDYELRFRTKNGKLKVASVNASLISDANGKSNHIDGSLRDITERKQAENELRESEESFRVLFEGSTQGILATDIETRRFLFSNPAICQIFGYSEEDFKELSIADLHPKDSLDSVMSEFESQERGEKPISFALPCLRKDGTVFYADISGASTIINGRKCTVGFFSDVTKRRQAEEELIIAKEHAEESDRLKSAFLANISHEIRTPMNGILGFAELLKEPQLTGEEQQEYISIIQKSGARMLNIINDIVSISKIESGQMKVSIIETNINEQIQIIYNFFTPEAEKKGLLLSIKNTLPADESIIKTDREKLYAVLTNLIHNAIKYTHNGSIEFGCEKKGKYLQFFVKDTGAGIYRDQMEIIFERFRQGNDLNTGYIEGTGLGLSISKAYIEMLGGKIWVESEPGKGSIFYFTLPYDAETEAKTVVENVVSADRTMNQIKKLKILIAEDDELSEMLMRMIVRKFCKEFLIARTGIEAVEVCRNNPDLDLVLMDIKMPMMNGYEASRQIRQFNKDVIIIAQTAFSLLGNRETAIEAGCNDYISKPININVLKELIKKHFLK